MSDQTIAPTPEAESQPSSEVLAILGQDQPAEEVVSEEVSTEETVEKNADEEKETVQPKEEEKTGEEVENVEEKKPVEDPKKEDDYEFLVAGKKYTSVEEAAKAVNRISGDNTRLAGDINSLTTKLSQKEEVVAELQKKVKEWEDYYNGEPGKEIPKGENVEDTVRKLLKEEKQIEQQNALKQQYTTELDDLVNEKDYSVVMPVMNDLAEKLGNSLHSISPKQLYKMARGVVRDSDTTQVLETAQKIADEKTKTEINKKEASKVVGGNAKKSPSIVEDEISPELAALLG